MNILTIEPGCPGKIPTVIATIIHNFKHLYDKKYVRIIDIPYAFETSEIKRMRFQFKATGGKIRCPSAIFDDIFVNYTPGFAGYKAFLNGLLK